MTSRLHSILETEGLTDLLPLFTEQEITDSVLADLSDADLEKLGISKMGVRKRLLAAFNQASSSGSSEVAAPAQTTASSPAEATKETPFINSLGMPFVPIPRFETRFCIWPVRVQDYEQYCAATGATYPPCPFPQGSDHPVVGVTWDDAIEFCVWLTGKERAEGKIDEKTVYRLPTDLEWSAAVGLPHEPEPTPEERHLKAPGYPWGLRWPPPENAGNYEHDRNGDYFGLKGKILHHREEAEGFNNLIESSRNPRGTTIRYIQEDQTASYYEEAYNNWLLGWKPVDKYEFTSPVRSFAPNDLGIYDLGGNVWELCMEEILRGSAYSIMPSSIKDAPGTLTGSIEVPLENQIVYRSSFRQRISKNKASVSDILNAMTNSYQELPDGGFRIVTATAK